MKNPFRGARYANVAATLALVVALGGTSYAAATIGTSDIKKNAVTSAKIKNKNVKTVDLKNNAVKSNKIKDDAVKAKDVADIQMQGLALINGWVPWDADRGAKYGKSADGVVHLSGGVKSGAGTIAVLPPGYRPTGSAVWISTNLVGGAGPARIVVSVNGNVTIDPEAPATVADAQAFTSLDGISFIP